LQQPIAEKRARTVRQHPFVRAKSDRLYFVRRQSHQRGTITRRRRTDTNRGNIVKQKLVKGIGQWRLPVQVKAQLSKLQFREFDTTQTAQLDFYQSDDTAGQHT